MLVVHLTSVHGAHDTRILHRECASLLGSKYTPVLVAPGRSGHIGEIRHIGVGRRRGLLGRLLLTHPRLFWHALRIRAPIYHFHDPELIPIGMLLKTLGAKVVYDVHEYYSEIIPLRVPSGIRGITRQIVHKALERMPAAYFDHLVFPTDALRLEYAGSDSASTLFNFPLLAASGRAQVQPEKKFHIIFVGTVSPFRAKVMVQVAMELVERGIDLRFLFVGIADTTVSWINDNFERDFVASHLVFVPRVGYLEVLDYMASSHVGYNYHPMEKRFEVAIPMKVFEYMLAGIPAVTTRFPELERLLEDGKEVVFCDEAISAQADAIQFLLNNPEYSARVASAGESAVASRLNWEVSESKKLTGLYDSLLGE